MTYRQKVTSEYIDGIRCFLEGAGNNENPYHIKKEKSKFEDWESGFLEMHAINLALQKLNKKIE
jgi:hypothetical protein